MNKVLLDLGIVQIYWYSICILIGMMVGMFLVYRETIKKGISDSLITNLIFYTIIVAVVGARLYYVIFDWKSYAGNPIEALEIWNGGLAIHGAIIFGGLFLIYYTKRHRMDTLKILDICSVGLIIGQAIGRWGNFFNQEVFGREVGISFLKGLHLPSFIIEGMHIGGKYYQPLFLYESLWCVLGFVVLLLIRKRKYVKTGQIFGIYCMWYSLGRFFLEGMRDPEYNLTFGPFKIAQVVSVGMFMVGFFFFIRRIKTSRFEYLYNDENISTEVMEEVNDKKPFYGSTIDINGQAEEATIPQMTNQVQQSVQPQIGNQQNVQYEQTNSNVVVEQKPTNVSIQQTSPMIQEQSLGELFQSQTVLNQTTQNQDNTNTNQVNNQ